ncbi:hypothetical protein [Thermotoga sp. SG1]|uniref:hypothetical protein n=1 Tax=Thermotoga sp. SG1 TaxID=126739 RepID=UPI000C77096E|nr:hypothetical protein [Thermotoga sp. SG1]PLV56187.1 hypothetical protein AS006_06410 [Thermotoga sp. SG1]
MTSPQIHILDFDGVYENQTALKSLATHVFFENMTGVRYVILPEKIAEVERILPERPGITFLGDGEFHHLTYLIIKRIKRPFVLLVFDHHLDAREGEFLTCDNWIRRSLRLKHLLRVVIVGAQEQEKIHRVFYSEPDPHKVLKLLGRHPVYLSIDKDVLDVDVTGWERGNILLEDLLNVLRSIPKRKILGVDICGEPDPVDVWRLKLSEKMNLSILHTLIFDEFHHVPGNDHLERKPAHMT